MNYLLKHLLTWLCFAGTTFFAAGAVIDAGAANETTDAGAGAGDGVESDAPDVSGGDADADAGAGGGAGNADQRDGAQGGDGRTLPKNIQSTLKLLKEAHPELAKDIEELRKGVFDSRQHREFFKTPTEARQAKATLDLLGGSEGISNLQSKVAAVEQLDAALEVGDPQSIEDFASDFPDGFKKLAGPYLDKLQALDPQSYAKTLQPHVFASMEAAGMGSVLDAIGQAIAGNDLAKAKDLIGKSLAWYEGQKQQAGQRTKADDPERVKFENDKKAFNQTREKTFREDIGRQTMGNQRDQVNKALAPYLKTKALSVDAKADLTDGIDREIQKLLKADSTYQSQVKALLTAKTRDSGKIVQYINAAVDEAARKATTAVWTRRGYGSVPRAAAVAAADKNQRGAVVNPPQGPGSSPTSAIRVKDKPDRSLLDIAKDPKMTERLRSRGVMNSGPYKGKWVTWQ